MCNLKLAGEGPENSVEADFSEMETGNMDGRISVVRPRNFPWNASGKNKKMIADQEKDEWNLTLSGRRKKPNSE